MSEEIKEKIKAYYIANDIDKILDYIKDLQQKVEQLEKKIKELKYDCSCSFQDAEELNQKLMEIIDERNELDTKLIQLENIRKEAVEYMKEFIFEPLLINEDRKLIMFNENLKNFENILNKGE